MYTFEDIRRIFISEIGIEQVLKRTEMVISSFEYLWLPKYTQTVADNCHWFPMLKACKRNDHNSTGKPITGGHDYELKKYRTQPMIDVNTPLLRSQLND